jgi:hypothetical protein
MVMARHHKAAFLLLDAAMKQRSFASLSFDAKK